MSVVPIGFGEVTMHWGSAFLNNQDPVTVFGVDQDPSFSAEAVATAVSDAFTSSGWEAQLGDDFTLTTIEVKFGPVPGGSEFELAVNKIGDRSTTSLSSPASCVLVRKGSALSGRQNRGRMYLPGMLIDADILDNGGVGSSRVTALQTVFTTFLADLIATTAVVEMVILHTDPLLTPTVVNTLTVDAMIASQRRRLRP